VEILTNSLEIVKHIPIFDYGFKKYTNLDICKTDDPVADKEIGTSVALKPVLSNFSSLPGYEVFHFLK
jgi:hypothetical protein